MTSCEVIEYSTMIPCDAVERDDNTVDTDVTMNSPSMHGETTSCGSMKDCRKKLALDQAVPDSLVALGMLEYEEARKKHEHNHEESEHRFTLPKSVDLTIRDLLEIPEDFQFDDHTSTSFDSQRSVISPVRVQRLDVPKDVHVAWDSHVASSEAQQEIHFECDTLATVPLEDRLMNFVFPYAPKTARGMVSLAFWHSFMFTVTAPLVRMMGRRWRTELFVPTVLNLLLPALLKRWLEPYGLLHPGTEYPEEGEVVPGVGPVVGIDLAFALHAGFGLLWMTSAYITICHAHKFHPKGHKYAGYITALTFVGHCCAAAYCLYTDVVRHTAISKLILFYVLVSSISKFLIAMKFARSRSPQWMNKHMDSMVDCYITSLAGAGPTRTVSQIQSWLGTDPSTCQNKYMGMASQCQVSYVNRLYWIGLFMAYMYGMYVKGRKSKDLTLRYVVNTGIQLSVCAVVFAMSWLPNAEEYLHAVFGDARSTHNHIVAVVGALFIVADGVMFYQRAVHSRPPLWKSLLENLKRAKALSSYHEMQTASNHQKIKRSTSSDLLLDMSIHGLDSNH